MKKANRAAAAAENARKTADRKAEAAGKARKKAEELYELARIKASSALYFLDIEDFEWDFDEAMAS